METISRFKEDPATNTGWRALKLGLYTLLIPFALGIYGAFGAPFLASKGLGGKNFGMFFGYVLGGLCLALSISALIVGIRALRLGERSWAVWLGFIPAVLIASFWLLLLAGDLFFFR